MDKQEFDLLVEKIGKEASEKISKELEAYKETVRHMIEGKLSSTQLDEARTKLEDSIKEVREVVEKQGATITDVLLHLGSKTSDPVSGKELNVRDRLIADRDELKSIFMNRTGNKTYMLYIGKDGEPFMRPVDGVTGKAAGPHAATANIGGSFAASIAQNIDSATLLRLGGASEVFSVYRNTPWIYDLANTYSVGFENPFFLYYNELAKEGGSDTIAEGGTKSKAQYKYELNSVPYNKEAVLVGFTEEFSIDFEKLMNDIMAKIKIDLVSSINSKILANIFTAGTAFNIGADYKTASGGGITDPNDWDVIAALAAQAEKATFTANSNVALISTLKKYVMGTIKNDVKGWVDVPDVLKGINMVSNPAVGTDNVLVGDLRQYNIALRGGILVKIGYNGSDFAQNMFSQVVEQYYFDYIADSRKVALVKGTDFSTVSSAISA